MFSPTKLVCLVVPPRGSKLGSALNMYLIRKVMDYVIISIINGIDFSWLFTTLS